MILAPNINNFQSPDMSIETLLKFFDNGGNIYIGLDHTSKQMSRSLVKEFGTELFPAKSTGIFILCIILYSPWRSWLSVYEKSSAKLYRSKYT